MRDVVTGRAQYESRIRYVDISDPGGLIALGDEVDVEGRVGDRWSMDEYQGVLRVASSQSWGNGDVHLTTFSVTDSSNIEQLGQYTLNINERWTSTRFDGERGYVVRTTLPVTVRLEIASRASRASADSV